jgi:hypothetical protein
MKEKLTEQQKRDLYVKAAKGTVIMASLYALSQAGDDDEPIVEITANGFNDYAKNADLQQTGWKPYHMRIKLSNGKYTPWVSYKETPFAFGMNIIGAMNDYQKYRKEKFTDDTWNKVGVIATGGLRYIADGTFIRSGETFVGSILDNKRENAFDYLKDFAGKTASGAVTPAAFTQISQFTQDVMDIPDKEIRETYAGRILKNIPVARDGYYNKVNGLGQEIDADFNMFVSWSDSEDSKLFQLLADKKNSTSPPTPTKTTVLDDKIMTRIYELDKELESIYLTDNITEARQKRIDAIWAEAEDIKFKAERFMTDEEFYYFSKVRGSIIRQFLSDNYDVLKDMNEKQFGEIMSKVKAKATTFAKTLVENEKTMKEEVTKYLQPDAIRELLNAPTE